MGNAFSGEALEGGRQQAVTEIKRRHRVLPPNSVRSTSEDWPFIEARRAAGGAGGWVPLLGACCGCKPPLTKHVHAAKSSPDVP